jgi:hypothetical protein
MYSIDTDKMVTFNYFPCLQHVCLFVCLMVFNATFNNISVILWPSVLLVEETGGPGEIHRPVTSH